MLKAGDYIQCADAEEMAQYSMDLENMGIITDFASDNRIIITGPWLDPEVEVPAEDGVFQFALVNGRAKKRSHLRRGAGGSGVLEGRRMVL